VVEKLWQRSYAVVARWLKALVLILVCWPGRFPQLFRATNTNITDIDEEHGHRVPRVCGKGSEIVLASSPRDSPPPPAPQQ
jgi:hypothetical protein